jgi:mannitol-1-phosphate 5-dehydrogenase
MIYRFGNRQLGDTINRVGNDTRRKLLPNDRLVAAARLCISHKINPVEICLGIAAAMKFELNQNSRVSELKNIIESGGPEAVLEKICALSQEEILWNMVLEFYGLLSSNIGMDKIVEITECMRN